MSRVSYGGQALMEGLMISGPDKTGIAVRLPAGDIAVKRVRFSGNGAVRRIPFLRGVVQFFSMNVRGIRALLYSAQLGEEQEEEAPGAWTLYLAAILAIAFSVGLFLLLPNLLISLFGFRHALLNSALEGVLRIGIFTLYLGLCKRIPDMRRVWMYHGAEHKTIHCYEHGRPLTVDNVRGFTTRHPRCGTSFLFLVMCMSILLFSFVGWRDPVTNLLVRLALIPVLAGLSYELFRVMGRKNNWLTRLLCKPGLAFQALTTSEPDDSQIEVAIAAFQAASDDEQGEMW